MLGKLPQGNQQTFFLFEQGAVSDLNVFRARRAVD
jgi:hypothetical protein